MPEVDALMAEMRTLLGKNGPLAGKTVVVTAGGTQEPLDPVRYIGNRSSGKMGFALAEAARDCGARVILIKAATTAPAPQGMTTLSVTTAAEMLGAVNEYSAQSGCAHHGCGGSGLPSRDFPQPESESARENPLC